MEDYNKALEDVRKYLNSFHLIKLDGQRKIRKFSEELYQQLKQRVKKDEM